MIKIENLNFYYSKEKPVFENVSLKIENGIYGLLGENGVGKTTLLHLICGLQFPKSGTCRIDSFNPALRNPDMMSQLFFLPEDFRMPIDSIYDFANRHSIFYPNFNKKDLEANLQDFHINGNEKLSKLSFGQKKKAMLAYTLSLNTPLILMDEPTNGLDISSKIVFKKMLTRTILDDKCLIVSTHQAHDFESLLDAIIIVGQNQVLLNSTVESILQKLYFSVTEVNHPDALYSEQTLQGYFSIFSNHNKKESPLNVELLYNAFQNNDNLVKTYLNRNTNECNF